MSGKYSLEALRKLRAAREDALELALSERQREFERRRLEQRDQADALEKMGAQRRRTRELEGDALGSDGGLRALDLVQGFQHENGQVAEEARQQARVQGAETELRRALSERERVVTELRAAQAELEAVERHRERWGLEQARKAEEAEDESGTERWNVTHSGPGRT